jgi:putative membrane protein
MKQLVFAAAVLAVTAHPAFTQTDRSQPDRPGQPPSQADRNPAREAQKPGGSDEQFVADTLRGNMAEVDLGRLAQEKAENAEVKKFGQRMVSDHGKALDSLKTLARQKSYDVPEELDAKHKAERDKLAKMSGGAFDRAFMQTMIENHRKTADKLRAHARSSADADVKAWAAKTLPTVEEHLKLAQNTNRAVGTSGTLSEPPIRDPQGPGQRGDRPPQGIPSPPIPR